jgi:plasmid stability protein
VAQLTLRVPDQVVPDLKQAAAASGKSLNAWATAVLTAAVDPNLAGDEAQRVRERLARAGLLMVVPERNLKRPRAVAVAQARAVAGRGRPLADLVSEDRT